METRRVTIVREDNMVGVNGLFYEIPCDALPINLHVVQWFGDKVKGEVETTDLDTGNEEITDFTHYQYLVDEWQAKKDFDDALAIDPYHGLTPEEKIARIIIENESNAKTVREEAIDARITTSGVEWQVDAKSLVDIKDAIADVEYLVEMGETIPETIGWITADNTIRATTLTELKGVKIAHGLRKQEIFEQYAVWRSGDKLTPFEVTYDN